MKNERNERGKGHPLPGSDEARHDEIPEHLERDKGRGDDAKATVQPAGQPVAPDGEPYGDDELKSDRQPQQDRGPGIAAREQREG